MRTKRDAELDRELEEYLSSLMQGMGRPERLRALGWYAAGLLRWSWPNGNRACCLRVLRAI